MSLGASTFMVHGDLSLNLLKWTAESNPLTNAVELLKIGWKFLTRPLVDPLDMIQRNISVMAFNLIYLFDEKHTLTSMYAELDNMELRKPIVGHVFPFHNLKKALHFFQRGSTTGKVVVRVAEDEM